MRALAILALLAAAPAEAGCRLALVHALDVSKSVDSAEFALEFGGLAAALRDAEVRSAILSPEEPVAIAAFEWSGDGHQAVAVDWLLLTDPAALEAVAARLEGRRRASQAQRTAVGAALAHAHRMLAAGPDCRRRVVDIAGDGHHNEGPSPAATYAALDFEEITVNALVIGGETRESLAEYFRAEVIRGPGAFVMVTRGFEDFAEAVRRKLLRELEESTVVAQADGAE